MKYIDLHSDTITELHYPKENLADNRRMVTLSSLRRGKAMIQCFSAFVPTGYYPRPVRDCLTWKRFLAIADKKDALLKLHKDALMPIQSGADLETCENSEKTGVLFTGEDLGVIGQDIKKLDTVYARGIRIATLTWNHENAIAFPNSKKAEVMQRGLKPFGFEVLEQMEEMGILADVSHLSDGGFWDVARHSRRPFLASHSNSRAVTAHPRNLTDEMIKAIAEHGGVIGLNFAPQFLSGRNDKTSRIKDMVRHVHHIRRAGGSDVLAIGSDFDGIRGRLQIASPAQMPLLAHALSKCGMKTGEIEKMFSENVLRLLKENL